VASKPELADYLQHMTVLDRTCSYRNKELIQSGFVASEIRSLRVPYEQRWLSKLEERPQEGSTALLVRRARILKTLEVEHFVEDITAYCYSLSPVVPIILDPIIHYANNIATSSKSAAGQYDKLWSIKIDAAVTLDQIAPLLNLLALTSLSLGHSVNSGVSDDDWPVPPRSSKIEQITLYCSSFSPSALKKLLSSCKALKSFSYPSWQIPGTSPSWYAETIVALEETHGETIEDIHVISLCSMEPASTPSACRALQAMPRLKLLRVDLGVFVGRLCDASLDSDHIQVWGLLPPNIQTLGILTNQKSSRPNDDYKDCFPYLLSNSKVLSSHISASSTSTSDLPTNSPRASATWRRYVVNAISHSNCRLFCCSEPGCCTLISNVGGTTWYRNSLAWAQTGLSWQSVLLGAIGLCTLERIL
jgi:hypothetical protein